MSHPNEPITLIIFLGIGVSFGLRFALFFLPQHEICPCRVSAHDQGPWRDMYRMGEVVWILVLLWALWYMVAVTGERPARVG
jgi:hypothetical protein